MTTRQSIATRTESAPLEPLPPQNQDTAGRAARPPEELKKSDSTSNPGSILDCVELFVAAMNAMAIKHFHFARRSGHRNAPDHVWCICRLPVLPA